MSQEINNMLSQQTGLPIEAAGQDGNTAADNPQIAVAEGMHFANRDMQRNWSYPDTVKTGTATMTKSELKAFKDKEEGFEMPQDETAARVDALENKMDQLLNLVTTVVTGQGVPGSPTVSPSQAPPEPEPLVSPPSPDEPVETVEEIEQPSPSETVLRESQGSMKPLSVGPSPEEQKEETKLIEEPDQMEDWESLTEEPKPPAPSQHEIKAKKAVALAEIVHKFLLTHDPHKRFRQFLPKIHRQLGYSGWSKPMQEEFDIRFKALLNDGSFVVNICRRIQDMSMGHVIGDRAAASMVACTAGFFAFALLGTSG